MRQVSKHDRNGRLSVSRLIFTMLGQGNDLLGRYRGPWPRRLTYLPTICICNGRVLPKSKTNRNHADELEARLVYLIASHGLNSLCSFTSVSGILTVQYSFIHCSAYRVVASAVKNASGRLICKTPLLRNFVHSHYDPFCCGVWIRVHRHLRNISGKIA